MSERKMMLGSEMNLDYLVVAEREAAGLGIKAFLSGSQKYGITYSMRVRAALLPSADQKLKAKVQGGGLKWPAIWPEFQWHRVAAERASNIVLVPSGHMLWEYDALLGKCPAAAAECVAFLTQRLGQDLVDNVDAMEFLASSWAESLKQLQEYFPTTPDTVTDKMSADYITDLFQSAIEGEKEPMLAMSESLKKKPKHKFGVIQGGLSEPANVDDDEIGIVEPNDLIC